jgi:hypothetical protein
MNVILQAVIALITVIALFSIANSLLLEGIRRWTKKRSTDLEKAIKELFSVDENGDWDVAEAFYDHNFIKKLTKAEGRKLPSWIPPDIFAETFIQMLIEKGKGAKEKLEDAKEVIESFENGVNDLPEHIQEPIRQLLLYVKQESGQTLTVLRSQLMSWYETYMNRVTALFKRKTRAMLFYYGIALAAIFNLDLVYLSVAMFEDEELRLEWYEKGRELSADSIAIDEEGILAYLEDNLESGDGQALLNSILDNVTVGEKKAELVKVKSGIQLPVGWVDGKSKLIEGFSGEMPEKILWKIFGIVLMAGALSFGAPFWFDILRKATRLDRQIKLD